MATWVNGGSTTVQKDSSKKHYYHGSTVSCSAVTNSMINASGQLYGYFSPGGSTFTFGSTGTQGQGTSNGETISSSIPATTGTVTVYVYASTYQNPACRNVRAVLSYGSKAQPSGYCSFTGGYVNPFNSKTFSFGVNYISGIDEQYTISSGTIYYKLASASSWTSQSFTGSSVTLPANTFTTGNSYQFYGRLVLDDGTTINTQSYTFDTVDGTPSCRPLAPNNAVIYGSTDFSWSYSNTKSTPQYAYDIQVSSDGGDTWETIYDHVVTTAKTAPEYSGFTAGEWLWRVRTYNNDNVASAWSETAMFISNVTPDAPTITNIDTTDRVLIQWRSASQAAFEVQIEDMSTGTVVFDSGEVYSSSTEYFVNEYLTNGHYLAKVKIINVYGKESPYGESEFTINAQGEAPDVSAMYSPADNGNKFTITNDGTYVKYYLKRNGELVASFTSDTYVDHFVNGRAEYQVIAIDANGHYGMTELTVVARVESARITLKDGRMFEIDRRWNRMFAVSGQEDRKHVEIEYLGSPVPEHVFSKMRTKRYSFAFFDPDRIGSELLGETVYYADQFGNGDWCAIISVSRSDEWIGDDTALELERTNGNEGITYETV